MKKFKRLFVLLIVLTLFSNMNIISYAKDKENSESSNYVSLKEAEDVAAIQIKSVISNDNNSSWNDGVKIEIRKALFDLDNELSGYYFGLVNKDGKDSGYIILSADRTNYPIIEYSQEGSSFIVQSIEVTKNKIKNDSGKAVKDDYTKVLYLGEITYLLDYTLEDNSQIIYDITTSEYNKVNKSDLVKLDEKDHINYEEVWDNFKNINDQYSKGSNPPNSGGAFITNPYSHESGYASVNSKTITNGYRYYNIMTDFSSGVILSSISLL